MAPRLHLLLVDDNVADICLAREAFERHADQIHLTVCESGHDALACIGRTQTTPPDLVVLDISMPGMDGFEVLAAIKADPQLAHLPVVMLSASDSPVDVTRAYSLRASAYLIKAHEYSTFVQQINALVGFWTLCRVSGKPIRAQDRWP